MIEAKLKDVYGTQVEISESGSGYFRMDFEGESFPKEKDNLGIEIPSCVSFTENQARVLQACLNSYFEEDE